MTNGYHFEPLSPEGISRWDSITEGYRTRELFHRRAWLDYLAESRGVTSRFWAIRAGSSTVGYFCAGLLQKGPFRILGSPLKGWGTNFMGPIVNEGFDQTRLLSSLEELAQDEGVAMAELEHPTLDEPAMAAHHYVPVSTWSYILQMTGADLDDTWNAIYPTKRNRIRKAIKAGLSVEDTDDPAIADEFYDGYVDLMRHKGLVPPYPRRHPRLLFQHLRKAGLLFALRVRDGEGRVLATGLFPHDDHAMYFWGGSSWQDGRDQCPNVFLHWSAMRHAAEHGLRVYNMCGYGRFKREFGGELVTFNRWHRCFWHSARAARRGYEIYFNTVLRLKAGWSRISDHRHLEA